MAGGSNAVDWLLQIFDPANISALFHSVPDRDQQPAFWVALGKIMWINILLSGDNALVIAMACRGLQPRQRFWGMVLGAGVAVFLRIIFTGIVATLMGLPYLKLVGGLALLVIAAKLLVPEQEEEDGVEAASHLWAAVQIVAIADIVMSLDNVIAVAAAANGSIPLLILGLAISVPLIVAGAALIMALLTRLPALVWAGAAPARLDRRRSDRDGPGVAAGAAFVLQRPGRYRPRCVLASLGMSPQFANSGHGGEVVLGILGVAVVLVAARSGAGASCRAPSTPPRRRALTPRGCAVVLWQSLFRALQTGATPASGRSPPRTRSRPPFPADDRVHPPAAGRRLFHGHQKRFA